MAVRCSMSLHEVIKLTLFQFPKIIPVFAAVFQMIDSFGDFKAPLLINHCLKGRRKRAEGTWWVCEAGGAVLNKNAEEIVLRMLQRAWERLLELERVRQGQMLIFGNAVRDTREEQDRSRSTDEVRGWATGTMTSKDFVFFTQTYIWALCLSRAAYFPAALVNQSTARKMCQDVSPSLDMPTERHFLKRQCWHRLRFMRMIRQFSFLTHIL